MNELNITNTIGIEPISLNEAKSYLRVDFDDDDSLITSLITSARMVVENRTDQFIIGREFVYTFDKLYNEQTFDISYVSSITGIWDGEVEIDNNHTDVLNQHSIELIIEDTPTTLSDIKHPSITGVLMYPFGDEIKMVMYILIGHFYEYRGAPNMDIPKSVDYILSPHRNIKAA